MPNSEIWDVVKVPFPYTNRPIQQFRPALVVARHENDGSPGLLWVLMITSTAHRRWAGDIDVYDIVAAGLPSPSMIRTAKIATIDQAHATRLGHLAPIDQTNVASQLTQTIALVTQGR